MESTPQNVLDCQGRAERVVWAIVLASVAGLLTFLSEWVPLIIAALIIVGWVTIGYLLLTLRSNRTSK